MNPGQSLTFFILCALALLILPLWPLLQAMQRAPRAQPAAEPEADGARRCEEFRKQVREEFEHLLHLARQNGPIRSPASADTPFLVLGVGHHLADQMPPDTRRLRARVFAAGHLDIPGEVLCDQELFAEGRLHVGEHALVRAALARRDIAIGRSARVTRWVRSERRLDVAEGGRLRGWASAGEEITLARRARFEHLLAPRIVFGRLPEQPPHADPAENFARFEPPQRHGGRPGNGRNLTIPPGHTVKADLMVSGRLIVGAGCRVIGDLRADRGIELGADVILEGAAYADGPIRLGAGCRVSGPLRSASRMELGAHCVVGSPEAPSTLCAQELRVASGCIAHGAVRAEQGGEVFEEEAAHG